MRPFGDRSPALLAALAAAALLLTSGGAIAAEEGVEQAPARVRAFPGEGLPLTAVVLRWDGSREDVARLRETVRLPKGIILDSGAVRRALLALQGLREVAEVEALTRVVDGGVELVLVAWSNVMVESVSFAGRLAHKEDELEELVAVRQAAPLIESQILRSVFALQDRMEEDGYLEAVARVEVVPTADGRRARVTFVIDAGPRCLVGEVAFAGDLGEISTDELRAALSTKAGGRYWPRRARRDAKTAQQFLYDRGYRTARVARPSADYDYGEHLMHLTYEVELGPRVEVAIVGAERRKLVKRGLLPFLGSQGYDPALLVYTVDRLRAWYQSRGFYRVDVEAEEVLSTDERIEVEIRIEPGQRYELDEIVFSGNESIAEVTLRRLMTSAEKSWLSPGTGRLVEETLEEDLRALRSYYALAGFREARIGPPEVTESGRRLRLEIPIVEGPRRWVGQVEFVGVEGISVESLAASLPLTAGGPFHQNLLERSVSEIRGTYRDEGFDNVLASAEVEWDESGRVADVVFRVFEGPRTVVRRVLVRGQQVTKTPMLERIVDLEPGDAVSSSDLSTIQRRLYRLGIFSRVDVDLGQGELLGGQRDVVVRLREGDRHRLSVGGGYDTEDGVRGLFGYSLGNLFGRAGSINFDTLVSQRERVFRLIFAQPVVGRLDVPVTYSLFDSYEEQTARSSSFSGDFVTEIQGAQIEASFPLGSLRVPVLLTYKRVENSAPRELELILFDRERADVAISSIGAALLVDRRDSQINPTRGRNTIVQIEYAAEAFGTDENFVKLFAQQTQYVSLGRLGILGASLRLGGIESYRGAIERFSTATSGEETPSACSPDVVPDFRVAVSERFFAGGRSTHRAYDLDTLGILGETLFVNRRDVDGQCRDVGLFPSGGNGLALFNVDYRYPIGDTFWATLFFDWGNVFADWREIKTDDLKRGLGAGVGWNSPIGPLRLEIGWKLDREHFEDPYQIFLSFGSAF